MPVTNRNLNISIENLNKIPLQNETKILIKNNKRLRFKNLKELIEVIKNNYILRCSSLTIIKSDNVSSEITNYEATSNTRKF